MSDVGRLVAVAAIAIGAGCLAAGSSQAGPAPVPDSRYDCVIQGLGQIAAPGIQSIAFDSTKNSGENDLVPNVLLLPDEDSGSYTFNGTGTCTHVNSDNDTPPTVAGVYPVNIASSGQYENTICGTGRFNGATTIATAGPPTATVPAGGNAGDAEGPVNAEFHVDLVSGLGKLRAEDVTNATGETGQGEGVVRVQALESDGNLNTVPCINENPTAFSAEMHVNADLNDPPVP